MFSVVLCLQKQHNSEIILEHGIWDKISQCARTIVTPIGLQIHTLFFLSVFCYFVYKKYFEQIPNSGIIHFF